MSRSRSQYVLNTFPASFYYVPNSGTISGLKNGNLSSNMLWTMTDEVTPGYFGISRRAGYLPVNPMSQTKYSVLTDTTGSTNWEVRYNGNKAWDQYWSGHLGVPGWIYAWGAGLYPNWVGAVPGAPDANAALTEALANARSRGFDLLTFLAEFRKTVELITNFRSRTLKRAERVAARASKSSDPVSAFAETWLEARYGWRILAFDIASIQEAIGKLSAYRTPFIRGYATRESSSTRTTYNVGVGSYWRQVDGTGLVADYGRASLLATQTYKRSVHAGVILEAVIDDIIEIDPIVTAWEVVPFSFILDWFLNVGDVLQAYTPFATENLLGSYTTTRSEIITSCVSVPGTMGNPSSGWYYLPTNNQLYELETVKVTTTRATAAPSASLSFNVNLNEAKLLDLASIFIAGWAKILKDVLKPNRI